MRTFEKSDKLHGVCYDVRGPVLDEAKEMERRGETVLHLNIGNPAPYGKRTSGTFPGSYLYRKWCQ